MAIRDTSLDSKIQQAAFCEFMENGYANASLRKIAKFTGATVGAIQTRYKTKNELFESCIAPLLADIQSAFVNIRKDYFDSSDINEIGLLPHLEKSMDAESNAIMELLFNHYDEAYLLICKSAGSAYENFFENIIKEKVAQSLKFFGDNSVSFIDEKLLSFLISLQFHSYRNIIESGCGKEEAKIYLSQLMKYHKGGYNAIFAGR